MQYTPNSQKEKRQMLDFLGIGDCERLFSDIPECVRMKRQLNLPPGMSEAELERHMRKLAWQNTVGASFLGAGCYNHYLPAAVDHILLRSELYTAYTPYQAEISQGVLQALFEYQSLICELTGQEVSNATMYDGPSALAEAAVMAHNITKRKEILVSDTLHPEYRQVLKTYCEAGGLTLRVVESNDGTSANLKPSKDTAAVVVQTPNFFGIIEETKALKASAESTGAVLIACVVEATSLGLLKPPEADIVAGEGQALGNPMSFGGPSFGFLTTSLKYVRNLPGRIVGETVDSDGKRGYALTLQAREQHIRREKATSNICTSQSLCALAAAAYLSLLGPQGLRKTAENSHKNALYLCERLSKIKGFNTVYKAPFYNEFLMKCPKGAYEKLRKAKITPGLLVQNRYPRHKDCILICTTEVHGRADLDRFVEAVR
jgi:glycine dehydrogenase subunit 1